MVHLPSFPLRGRGRPVRDRRQQRGHQLARLVLQDAGSHQERPHELRQGRSHRFVPIVARKRATRTIEQTNPVSQHPRVRARAGRFWVGISGELCKKLQVRHTREAVLHHVMSRLKCDATAWLKPIGWISFFTIRPPATTASPPRAMRTSPFRALDTQTLDADPRNTTVRERDVP